MNSRYLFTAVSVLLLLVACGAQRPQPTPGVTFVVVRHAEKADDDPRDPMLTQAGRARAAALATLLDGQPLAAAYSTAFTRTQQTAQPSASAAGIVVTTYAGGLPAAEFAAQLRNRHAGGTVLVVGHSNTVPDLVAALCNCEVAPLGDGDYGNLYRVGVDGEGHVRLDLTSY